jgi:hypothetical protein
LDKATFGRLPCHSGSDLQTERRAWITSFTPVLQCCTCCGAGDIWCASLA